MLVLAPYLPHSDNPVLAEWVEELDRLDIDEATCVVAHSRG